MRFFQLLTGMFSKSKVFVALSSRSSALVLSSYFTCPTYSWCSFPFFWIGVLIDHFVCYSWRYTRAFSRIIFFIFTSNLLIISVSSLTRISLFVKSSFSSNWRHFLYPFQPLYQCLYFLLFCTSVHLNYNSCYEQFVLYTLVFIQLPVADYTGSLKHT